MLKTITWGDWRKYNNDERSILFIGEHGLNDVDCRYIMYVIINSSLI